MPNPAVVGFSGNITRPSKTRAFVDLIVQDIATRHDLSSRTYDIDDLGPLIGSTPFVDEASTVCVDQDAAFDQRLRTGRWCESRV